MSVQRSTRSRASKRRGGHTGSSSRTTATPRALRPSPIISALAPSSVPVDAFPSGLVGPAYAPQPGDYARAAGSSGALPAQDAPSPSTGVALNPPFVALNPRSVAPNPPSVALSPPSAPAAVPGFPTLAVPGFPTLAPNASAYPSQAHHGPPGPFSLFGAPFPPPITFATPPPITFATPPSHPGAPVPLSNDPSVFADNLDPSFHIQPPTFPIPSSRDPATAPIARNQPLTVPTPFNHPATAPIPQSRNPATYPLTYIICNASGDVFAYVLPTPGAAPVELEGVSFVRRGGVSLVGRGGVSAGNEHGTAVGDNANSSPVSRDPLGVPDAVARAQMAYYLRLQALETRASIAEERASMAENRLLDANGGAGGDAEERARVAEERVRDAEDRARAAEEVSHAAIAAAHAGASLAQEEAAAAREEAVAARGEAATAREEAALAREETAYAQEVTSCAQVNAMAAREATVAARAEADAAREEAASAREEVVAARADAAAARASSADSKRFQRTTQESLKVRARHWRMVQIAAHIYASIAVVCCIPYQRLAQHHLPWVLDHRLEGPWRPESGIFAGARRRVNSEVGVADARGSLGGCVG
ncbi:hypothetical protein K525DRAFT_279560 [Schizophyllum commune Loenen D]|nr:hypothetical protein K525DRAFT_279560 [Schizophyllum commune Loenen D]